MDALKIRGLRILLFPVIAPLLLLGWVLIVVGERQAYSEAVTERKSHDYVLSEKPNEDEFEMGSIDEIVAEKSAY